MKHKSLFILSLMIGSFLFVSVVGYGINSINKIDYNSYTNDYDSINLKNINTPQNALESYDRIISFHKEGNADSKYIDNTNINNFIIYSGNNSDSSGNTILNFPKNEFINITSTSDDSYSYLKPSKKDLYFTQLDNYFTTPLYLDKENEVSFNFAHWLGSQTDTYLIYDEIKYNNDDFQNVESYNINNRQKSFFSIEDVYLLSNSSYYTFTSNEDFNIEFEVGGIRLYEDQLLQVWSAIQNYKIYYFNAKNMGVELITWVNTYMSDQTEGMKQLVFAIDSSMHLESYKSNTLKILSLSDFNGFLSFMGVDLTKGYKSFSYYNPNQIYKIYGKLLHEIISSESVESYSVEIFNYYLNDWTEVINRSNVASNVILEDQFYISANAWQYLDDPYNEKNQVKWRILFNNSDQISYRNYGIWTKLETAVSSLDVEFEFKVENDDISKTDLLKNPEIIIEYTSFNIKYDYEKMFLCYALEDQYGNPEDYFVSILEGSYLDPSVNKDERTSYPIPLTIVKNDTSFKIRLRGFFGFFDKNGMPQNIIIGIDSIKVKYEYEKEIPVKYFIGINEYNLNYIDWIYEIDIDSNIYETIINYPDHHIFLHPDLQIIEDPNENNIAYNWFTSTPNELKYGANYVRITKSDLLLFGNGVYRFWFKSYNFISQSNINNYEGVKVLDEDQEIVPINNEIIYGDEYSYQLYLKSFMGLNSFNQLSCYGIYNITFSGKDAISGDDLIENYHGNQSEYYDEKIPDVLKYNKYYFNLTISEGTFSGKIDIEYIWQSDTDLRFGISFYSIRARPYFGDVEPRGVFVSPKRSYTIEGTPVNVGELGYSVDNYIIFRSYHIDTVDIKYNITNEARTTMYQFNNTLYKYSDVETYLELYKLGTFQEDDELNDLLESIYKYGKMPDLPLYESDYSDEYFINYINPSMIDFPIDSLGRNIAYNIDLIITAEGGSGMSYFKRYSDTISNIFEVVSKPRAVLYNVYNVNMLDYLTINYNLLSKNINEIKISLYSYLQDTNIEIINTSENINYEWIASHRSVSLILPFRFGVAGEYEIIMEIKDEFNNVLVITSNTFEIIDPDQRTWLGRIMDDFLNYLSSWFVLFSAGIVIKSVSDKKKKNIQSYNNHDFMNLNKIKRTINDNKKQIFSIVFVFLCFLSLNNNITEGSSIYSVYSNTYSKYKINEYNDEVYDYFKHLRLNDVLEVNITSVSSSNVYGEIRCNRTFYQLEDFISFGWNVELGTMKPFIESDSLFNESYIFEYETQATIVEKTTKLILNENREIIIIRFEEIINENILLYNDYTYDVETGILINWKVFNQDFQEYTFMNMEIIETSSFGVIIDTNWINVLILSSLIGCSIIGVITIIYTYFEKQKIKNL